MDLDQLEDRLKLLENRILKIESATRPQVAPSRSFTAAVPSPAVKVATASRPVKKI